MSDHPVTNREVAQIARLIDPPLCYGWTYESLFPKPIAATGWDLAPGSVAYVYEPFPKWMNTPRGFWRD